MKKELSVIIPVYNGEKYLKHAVDSVLHQNKDVQFEIILVDDGSNDNSFNIISQLKSYNPELIIAISKANGGIASARNAGLTIASGSYITFLDQDDECVQSYRTFIDHLKKENAEMLITDYFVKNKECIIKNNSIAEQRVYSGESKNNIVRELIGGKNIPLTNGIYINPPCSIWNCIVSADLIRKNNIMLKKIVDFEDDWIFLIESIIKAKKVCFSDQAYYCWTNNQLSESHRHKYIPDFFKRRLELIEWIHERLEEVGVEEAEVQKFDYILHFRTLMWCLYNETWNEPTYKGLRNVKEISHYYSQEQYEAIRNNIEMSITETILFRLLKKGKVRKALFINKYFSKKYYH